MDREPPAEGPQAPRIAERSPLAAGSSLARRLRGAIEAALGLDPLWAIVAVLGFILLAWRVPWNESLEDLTEGRIARADIVAPFDVEVPDEARAEEIREAARRAVDEVYIFEPKASVRVDRELRDSSLAGGPPGSLDSALASVLARPGGAPIVESVRQIVHDALSQMIVARSDTLPQGRAITVRYFGEGSEITLHDPGRVIDIEEARRRVRETAARQLGSSAGRGAAAALADPKLADLVGKWAASLVQPTLTYDLYETRRRMDEAARQVPALYSRVPKGKVLVRKGQPLTRDAIREILEIQQARPHGFDATALLGTLIVVVFLTFFLWRYARDYRGELKKVRHLFSFLVLALAAHVVIARAALWLIERLVVNLHFPFDRIETHWYVIPAASGAVLVSLLAGERIAAVYSLFASVTLAILFDWSLPYAVFALLTHLAGVYGVGTYRTRTAILRAGLIVGLAGAAVAAGLGAIRSGFSPWQVCVADVAFAFVGGAIGVPAVVAFLLPIYEWLFGVLTDIRLLELSNLDNPLLSELALRAPGSYNHSIIVGTLAEAAAEAIGANALFCRVAAYYHDVGKMKMPEYYIENQKGGENPHDRLAPSMSALILTNHVKEGMRLGREHGLPEAILDIIPQHHGTRVMTYFFEKAKKTAAAAGDPPPRPDDYRHPGPKPRTREAAIFMLADSVEAAARTIAEPTDDRFRDLIRQIVGRVVLDGQFDHCELTFQNLDQITEAFVRCLGSIYHHRIDYPTFIFQGASGRRAGRPERGEAGRTDPSTSRPPEKRGDAGGGGAT